MITGSWLFDCSSYAVVGLWDLVSSDSIVRNVNIDGSLNIVNNDSTVNTDVTDNFSLHRCHIESSVDNSHCAGNELRSVGHEVVDCSAELFRFAHA